jgi:hypothetical protein
MAFEQDILSAAMVVWGRFMELALAPLQNQEMLWAALPLVIATVFITLYFGRNKGEELGWNTAFGNTMVFLFTAIGIIRQMYYQGGGGSWDNVFSSNLYTSLALALAGTSIFLMAITYFHLMPKKVAFVLFSAPPINVSVYVAMSIVYANVIPDLATLGASIVLLALILVVLGILKRVVGVFGYDEVEKEMERAWTLADRVESELLRRKPRKAKKTDVDAESD